MSDTKAFEGVIEDISIKPIGENNRYVFKISGNSYSIFDSKEETKAICEEFKSHKGKKVKGTYYETEKNNIVFKNISTMVLDASTDDFKEGDKVPVEDVKGLTDDEIKERKDRRSMRSICLSYAKDIHIACFSPEVPDDKKVTRKQMLDIAEGMFKWVWEGD